DGDPAAERPCPTEAEHVDEVVLDGHLDSVGVLDQPPADLLVIQHRWAPPRGGGPAAGARCAGGPGPWTACTRGSRPPRRRAGPRSRRGRPLPAAPVGGGGPR